MIIDWHRGTHYYPDEILVIGVSREDAVTETKAVVTFPVVTFRPSRVIQIITLEGKDQSTSNASGITQYR